MSVKPATSSQKALTEPTPTVPALTPAMRQYVEQKRRVGDAILLFRMGDFYETFYEDAVTCSKILGIALTSRNKGTDNPIPLAGIPYHALDVYLKKLVVAGRKVAISEQMEDPKQAKGVVRRDVVRIVTAGTLTDDELLDSGDDHTLAAIVVRGDRAGLALVDLAGGRFEVIDVTRDTLLDELVKERPAELLIDDERDGEAQAVAEPLRQICGTVISRRPAHELTNHQAERTLRDHFGVSTLSGFGFDAIDFSLQAAGCILQYLQETQKTALGHITSIRRRLTSDFVQIDHSSWRSLEIDRTLRTGSREGTLLWAIDRTVHPIGGRTLRRWLRESLIDRGAITARQQAVGYFVDDMRARESTRRRLKSMADVERIASRVALRRSSPRDLAALGATLVALPALANELGETGAAFLNDIFAGVEVLSDLGTMLQSAIRADAPVSLREGGFIVDGHDTELDRLRSIGRNGREWLAEYQRTESQRTGIANLKVGFNRVFGYYIEISNAARGSVPPEYVRKQTIKSAERYITDELKKYETEVLTAQERANELEQRLFEKLLEQAASRVESLLDAARAIGTLDCVAGLAELAVERRYVRPELVDDGRLDIHAGRHPVLDLTLGDDFVPNDTHMDRQSSRVFVITGPNMAGKSTYIRQTALLTLLAQTGSFVPAQRMTLSPVDRIFARVGSTDEIMRGRSTFMVEMSEAANILHNATAASLVVLDELGRGTSTFDGLALLWAITEHLANETGCRCLVATHYHELTELAALLKGVRNYNVAVKEYAATDGDEGIAFLHKIVEGAASKSYGVHVAKLAGIPNSVIGRSREILDELQRGFERESRTPQLSRKKTRDDAQLELFRDAGDELIRIIRDLDPNAMTPLEAIKKISEWKQRFGGDG